jgi:hypothetical protein
MPDSYPEHNLELQVQLRNHFVSKFTESVQSYE